MTLARRAERAPVPSGVSLGELEARQPRHQVELARPAVPKRHGEPAEALGVEDEVLLEEPLRRRVVARHLEHDGALLDRERLDPLAPVVLRRVEHEALEHERAVGLQHTCDVPEALGLAVGVRQVVERVVDEVHELERPRDRHVGHVADRDGDPVASRLRPEPVDHRLGRLDALDRNAPGRQRQGDATRSDGELEDAPASRQTGQELDGRARVELAALVVDAGPVRTEELGIVEGRHARHSSRIALTCEASAVGESGGSMRAVVLVEGESDRNALEALAERRGRDLAAEGVAVEPIGGAQAIGRFLERFGPRGLDVRLAGLYDAGEEPAVRRSLERAGLGSDLTRPEMERLGFYACVQDLEDELIRSLGPPAVEEVVAAQGELRSFRTFQRQPAQRDVPIEGQLRRFMGTHSGRKIHYGRVLVEALDMACVPPPLDLVLAHVGRG